MKKLSNILEHIVWWLYVPTFMIVTGLFVLILMIPLSISIFYEKWIAWKSYKPVNLTIFKEGAITQRKRR